MRHAAYFYYPNDEPVLYIAIISPDNRVRLFTEWGTEACRSTLPLEWALRHGRFVQLGVTNRRSQCKKYKLETGGEREQLPPPLIGGRKTVQPYFDPNGNGGLGCWCSHKSNGS